MDIMGLIVLYLVIKVVKDVGVEIIINVVYAELMVMLIQICVYVILDIIWIHHLIVNSVITLVEVVQAAALIVLIVNIDIEH